MSNSKRPFDVRVAVRRLRKAVAAYPKAALFELAAEGHDSVFEQLVACMITIRTRDETTLPVAAPTLRTRPHAGGRGCPVREEIDDLIGAAPSTRPKAAQIHAIARRAVDEHGGALPCDADVLLSLPRRRPQVRQPRARHRLRPAAPSAWTSTSTASPTAGATSPPRRRRRRWLPCKRRCRAATGSRSTPCWSPSASTFARGICRSVRRVRCWRCAGRSG